MARHLLLILISFRTLFTTGTAQTADLAPPEPQEYYRICPFPRCKTCPSVEELRAPGVGFALETNHGAAAVKLHDGTLEHVALIEGDPSYTALMRRLATGPINRTPDHSDTSWETLQYLKSRSKRLANKLLGRPATPETAILAAMISKLLRAVRMSLGDQHPIVGAVLSSPDRIHLTHEEIGDVFDYLKLRNLMDEPWSLYQLYATSAAYAGYGKGLCRTYTDAYACELEESKLPFQRMLHVDLNSESLSATLNSLQTVKEGLADASFIDPDLGSGRQDVCLVLTTTNANIGEQYWTAVSARIRELATAVQAYAYVPHITELLLTGPSATDARFHAAIRAALHDLVANASVLALVEDGIEASNTQTEWESLFSFATARGAAEIAKRRQEGPVNCAQSDECRQRREHVHEQLPTRLLNQKPFDE